MLFNVFKRKLFGNSFEKILKYIIICIAVFFGMQMAEISIHIADYIKYLMSGTFTAGIIWHSLSSDNTAELSGIAMLPFSRRHFTFSYISTYGLYTVITKSALLISVMSAVSIPDTTEILGMLLCIFNGVTVTSAIYVIKKHRFICFIWAAFSVSSVFSEYALFLLSVDFVISLVVLMNADPYNFINSFSTDTGFKSSHNHSIWKYLLRYITAHNNYIFNTVIMWAVAIILPAFMIEIEGNNFLPAGFAILSINTPLCVLISADKSLREAIHFLPSGTRIFCLPYFSFIAVNNLISYVFYLISFSIQAGGTEPKNIILAVIFALLSASGSVFMEIKFPLTNYKTESDLWHHPRKYIVPSILLVTAGAMCLV